MGMFELLTCPAFCIGAGAVTFLVTSLLPFSRRRNKADVTTVLPRHFVHVLENRVILDYDINLV